MKNKMNRAIAFVILLLLSQTSCKAQPGVTADNTVTAYEPAKDMPAEPAAGSANLPSDYKGIYVGYDTWTGNPISDDALKNPDVFGVLIKVFWKKVEPEQGKFDWSFFNSECSRAQASGKKIAVSVIGGRHAPDWIYQKGARKLDFREAPGEGEDKKIESMSIPVPWDDAYLKLWQSLIENMAANLKSDPKIWDAVVRVNVAGITLKTDEIRLPTQNRMKVANKETTDAAGIWQSVGYKPQLVITAWEKILKMYADNFTGKIMSMAIIPLHDFPTLDNDGRRNDKRGWLTRKLVQYGIETYKGRFAVQFDALTDNGGVTKLVTEAGSRGAIMGSQINHRKYADPDCLKNNTPCDNEAFKKVLDNGINNGFAWIEVFEKDVIAYPKAMAYAKNKFK